MRKIRDKKMNGAEIIRWLEGQGFSLRRTGPDRLEICPEASDAIVERVRARKADVLACLDEFTLPLELAHAYVLWSEAEHPEYTVCLRCGYPPPLHSFDGRDPLETAIRVDDANGAALLAVKAAVENAAVRVLKERVAQ